MPRAVHLAAFLVGFVVQVEEYLFQDMRHIYWKQSQSLGLVTFHLGGHEAIEMWTGGRNS